MFWRAHKNVFYRRVLLTRGAKVSMTSESSVETTLTTTTTKDDAKGGSLDGEERWAKFDDSVDGNNKLTQIVTLYREENGSFEPKAYNVKLQSAEIAPRSREGYWMRVSFVKIHASAERRWIRNKTRDANGKWGLSSVQSTDDVVEERDVERWVSKRIGNGHDGAVVYK